jgi:hypothetical protein
MANRPYNILPVYYNNSQPVMVPANCNGFVAVNTGAGNITIDGVVLLPRPGAGLSGESYGVAGNRDEIFVGNNNQILVNVPPGGQVLIIWKYYINEC